MKKIFFTICFITLLISPVYADDSVIDDVSSMNLTDNAGGGPGVIGIAKSAAAYITYSGAAGAGYAGGIAGQTMACVAFSNKAIPQVQLRFGVRASNDVGYPDDNTIYQDPNGTSTPFAAGDTTGAVAGTTLAGWMVRGGS